MPIKTNKYTEHKKLMSLYVNNIEYMTFLKTVAENEEPKSSSAVLRTLMYLYSSDKTLQNQVSLKIKDFIVFNKDGTKSKL